MKVLVTRPAAQAHEWVQALRGHGVQAQALPLIEIAPPANLAAVQEAWRSLPRYALAVFVSPNAVEQFFAARPHGALWPRDLRAASPGPGTDLVLDRVGLAPALRVQPAADAPQFDSESLWQVLRHHDWRGGEVLIVRSNSGREWLAQRLAEAGARVDFVSAYERRAPRLAEDGRALLREAIQKPRQHLWFFSSSESVDHLESLGSEVLAGPPDWSGAQALATHPRIASRARRLGMGSVTECAPRLDAVVRSIQSFAP